MIRIKPASERHECIPQRKGDWIVYNCPSCDYQLWDNMETGETKVFNAKTDIRHSGSYFPTAYQKTLENLN